MDRKKGEKMKHVNTTEMYFKVINCEEADELKEIINKYSQYYSNWRDYVNNVMLSNGLSYEKLCSETAINNFPFSTQEHP